MRRSKPFHKRWHGDAIGGYARLSLEERGAYTTLLDQMYDYGGPIRDEVRLVCAWLNCDVRVWKRLRAALVDLHGKFGAYSDENGVSWLVNSRVQSELGLPTYDELVANLSPKLPIAIAELSPKSDENTNENNNAASEKSPKNNTPIPLPESNPPIVPQGTQTVFELEGQSEPLDLIEEAVAIWNRTARRCGLGLAKGLSDARRKAIRKRLTEAGIDGWREAVLAVETSKFLRGMSTGRDNRSFRADLDFVCQARSFARLREGFYGTDISPPADVTEIPKIDPWEFKLRRFTTGSGYWNDADDGPRPGLAGCQAPSEILAKHGFGGSPTDAPFEPRRAEA